MKKAGLLIMPFLLFGMLTSLGQVAINEDASLPDSSAILDLKSVDRGLLVPRMTGVQRAGINFPAKGLMVFQTDTLEGFYYYDGVEWVQLSSTLITSIADKDQDTRVETEQAPDEDIIRLVSRNNDIFIVDSTGNIGIGTSSPEEKMVMEGGSFDHKASGNLKLVGNINLPSHPNEIFIAGSFAYVASYEAGLRIIDISDPSAPEEIGYFDTPGLARDVKVAGNYAYIADSESGLRIIDVSNPSGPFEVGYSLVPEIASNVFISGRFAYVTDFYDGLWIFDISDPRDPLQVSHAAAGAVAHRVFVSGNYAYVVGGYDGLIIIDVSNPYAPVIAGGGYGSDYPKEIFVNGRYAYMACFTGLMIVDISNPASPVQITNFDTPSPAEDVFVAGNYAYVLGTNQGLVVLDIADPENPEVKGGFSYGYTINVATNGMNIYFTVAWCCMKILEMNGISTPAITTGNISATNLQISGNTTLGSSLNVSNSLNVGNGGIMTLGPLSVASEANACFKGNVGIGTSSPLAALHVSDTSAMIIPVGTTSQRPGTPQPGMLRYNSTTAKIEAWAETSPGSGTYAWVELN